MTPGDPNSLIINVLDTENHFPDSLSLAPLDSILGHENILKKSGWRKLSDGWSFVVEFTFFEEGEFQISGIPVQFRSSGGEVFLLKTQPKTFRVLAERITDTTALREIKDIRREPVSWLDHLPLLLSILAVLLAAAFFIWWKNRQNRAIRNPQSEIRNPETPWEWAFSQLDILEKKSLWQAGGAKQYHTELTEILRGYLSRRFGMPAFKKTSDEILAALESTDGFSKNMIGPLRELFLTVDLVKFARAEPPNDFHTKALLETRELIRATIPENPQTVPSPRDQSVAPENDDFQRRIKVAFHALPNQPHPVLTEEIPMKYAFPARRFSAGLIDALVWLGGSVGIFRAIWWVVDSLELADDGKIGTAVIALLLAIGLYGFGYFFHVYLEKIGATPGKIAFGIIALDESGEPMSQAQARRRASLKINPAYWKFGEFQKNPSAGTGYDLESGTGVFLRK